MTILPSVYFGSIEYWAALVQAGDNAIIDIGENYVKRSERNRTEIMTSGGVMQLSVQLAHANRPRQPMRTMRIDYSKRWQHQHLIAIESAYRSSPYYDYYADRFTPLYEREWERLIDLNMATLESVCKTLKISVPRISDTYITATEDDLDLRDKKRGSTLCAEPYIQVFDDRLPFAPNLSIFDLLMCEGREATQLLGSCQL
jgi:hypothetical protein